MSDIIPKKSINIEDELGNLAQYKYHPNGILNVSLNRLRDITNGRVEITDPSNPFTYLLETNCINTAFAIQEMTFLTRKLYPKLANTEQDLYLHMSDKDYKDRFSSPSYADVEFNVLFSDFKTHAYRDNRTGDYIHTIPRNTRVKIDNCIYSLPAPIEIRVTSRDIVDVKFLSNLADDLFPLPTTLIPSTRWNLAQDEEYLSFSVKLPEINLEVLEVPVEKSKLFKGTTVFDSDRKFFYFKAYHLTVNGWEEIKVTHTDQVYDIGEPTVIVQVDQLESRVNYYIPPVYVSRGRIGEKVKFVTYTTLGSISKNYNEFKVSDFKLDYNKVFPSLELDASTEAMNAITKLTVIKGKVEGGSDGLSFSQLKKRVISNSLNNNNKPITTLQIDDFVNDKGFSLVKNIDLITNRMFLLEANLPSTSNRYGTSSASLDIMELKTSIRDLRENTNSVTFIGNEITIIPEKTLFEIRTEGLVALTEDEKDTIVALSGERLVSEVNNRRLVELFYHYVIESTEEKFDIRAYNVSTPKVNRVSFLDYNGTTEVGINSLETMITKIETGYQLDILSSLVKGNSMVSEGDIVPYLIYQEESGSVFYLEGRVFMLQGENPVWRFYLNSDFYINEDNRIDITNFRDNNETQVTAMLPISGKLKLLYVTDRLTAGYVASDLDKYLYGSYILPNKAGVTLEEIDLRFADHMEYLYTSCHTSTGLDEYERYAQDVPAVYDRTVYNPDNTVKYNRNQTVEDEEGNTVYKHRAGDIILDTNGDPIPVSRQDPQRYLSLMFMDYMSAVANNSDMIEYKQYLREYITKLVVEDVSELQDKFLENTTAYMTVPSTINDILVTYDGMMGYVSATQPFKLIIYLTERYYDDVNVRIGIEEIIQAELSDYLASNRALSKSVLSSRIYQKVEEFVVGIDIELFTNLNANYITLKNEGDRMAIGKILSIEPDGYRIKEDLNISFFLV